MSAKLLEADLGIAEPWFVQGVDFEANQKTLTIGVDFVAGNRFAVPGIDGIHPAHDTVTKRLRHLNFFQHECYLEVRMPRVRLPDGGIRLVEPDWAGKLAGFTLLFEALVITLCREMPFAAVARLVNLSWHKVAAICSRSSIWRGPKPISPVWHARPWMKPRVPRGTTTLPCLPMPTSAVCSLSPRGEVPTQSNPLPKT
jgi:hypothetical protein